MDVLKLQSTKADWNTKCSFHILAYIYAVIYWIFQAAISSKYCLIGKLRLDVDSQRKKIAPFIWISGVKEYKTKKSELMKLRRMISS